MGNLKVIEAPFKIAPCFSFPKDKTFRQPIITQSQNYVENSELSKFQFTKDPFFLTSRSIPKS